MIRQDIREILEIADEMIVRVESQHAAAKSSPLIARIEPAGIKVALEQLRSALDYLAHQIDEGLYGGARSKAMKIYFPYGDVYGVPRILAKQYPDLDLKHPRVYGLIMSLQKSATESDWLKVMCDRTNANKHHGLSEQDREGTRAVVIGNNALYIDKDSKNINFINSTIDGILVGRNGVARIDGGMELAELRREIPRHPIRIEIVDHSFKFSGTKWDVLELLKTARVKIGAFSEMMMAELGL